jgi:hypothetical protein
MYGYAEVWLQYNVVTLRNCYNDIWLHCGIVTVKCVHTGVCLIEVLLF